MQSQQQQQLQQPPATPTYILRGHNSPIHGLHIFHKNLRLISGDADGWIIVWDLVFKRPVAVWKAHDGAILEVKGFTFDNGTVTEVYTHGRDHKLCVWRFRLQDESLLQKTLPVDVGENLQSQQATQPWLVHSLPVNALNFCAFSMLFLDDYAAQEPGPSDAQSQGDNDNNSNNNSNSNNSQRISLFAVPNALDSGAIDLFHLPRERRVCTIPAGTTSQTGMVMAVNLFHPSLQEKEEEEEKKLYVASAYEDGQVMVFVRRGRLTEPDFSGKSGQWKWEKVYVTRAHSQPVLSIDVCVTAGYFVSSAADALLVKHPVPGLGAEVPVKKVDTKHSGQQGVRVRSDGKIFATAGWDSRIRVYSCKTMRELAVLKWHKEGCYTVAFADVSTSVGSGVAATGAREGDGDGDDRAQVTRRGGFSLATVQQQRSQKVQKTHWLAAGSKDGKISLWDIY
ncbi:ASTRA-associated protein 1 [Aspergillus bertholletiae]|uniref:ASTRA-associated protein 1 n=1 Tax=Aspergillus bertholletiae TaxID=1226010 RepID=A0A5N7AQ92_9EURO|nr:ASTRA-associated protein 1 [Aspergillus bertholletiae]